ncbi:MAG TPA: ABC transporter substrate-binding protein [Acidimicrobiales bacterium]|nr:ABC transporter substrate-binding protein [Acidimicrobiales bacterium]
MPPPAGPARWWAPLLALAVIAGACSALDGDDATPAQEPVTTIPEASTLLRVASGEWTDCLHPLLCDDDVARTLVLEHVVPKLMEVDGEGRYVPSPVLASEPEVRVDDETGEQTIVFVIDPAARWHDGRPITSSDVTGTWLAHLRTPGADTRGHRLITAIDDSDPLVARVTLSQRYADWPELFGGQEGWLLQADAFDGDADLSDVWRDFVPFGAGPFELVSFDERSLVLVARRDHWAAGRQARIDQVRIEHVAGVGETEGSVPGGIDVVLPAVRLDRVPEGYGQRDVAAPAVVGVFFDRRTAPLGSAGVRAAVDQALDRRELASLGTGSSDRPSLVGCLAALPADEACEADLPRTNADLDAARFLLELDGWPVDPATGVRGRPGLPLATPVTYDPAVPGARPIAGAVAEALESVGFAVEVRELDHASWADPARAEGAGVSIQAVPLGTTSDVARLYGCSGAGMNALGWCDADVQGLVDRLRRTLAEDGQDSLRADISGRAAEALSWLPLRQRVRTWLFDGTRLAVPSSQPLAGGRLGALHAFERLD